MNIAAALSLWGLLEKIGDAWTRWRSRKNPPPDDPTATAPATEPTGRHRHAATRFMPGVGGAAKVASCAILCSLAVGCGVFSPAFKASSIDELVKMCNTYAPADPCPPVTPAPLCPPPGQMLVPIPDPPPVDPGPGDDTSPPGPPDNPPVPDAGGGQDQIPANTVAWNAVNPSAYPITATLGPVTVAGGTTGPARVCWSWSRPSWPMTPDGKADGNMFVIARVGGRLVGAEWEMTSPRFGSVVCRNSEAKPGQPPMIQARGLLSSWVPAHGEAVCWTITTLTRNVLAPVGQRARTPIRCGTWP